MDNFPKLKAEAARQHAAAQQAFDALLSCPPPRFSRRSITPEDGGEAFEVEEADWTEVAQNLAELGRALSLAGLNAEVDAIEAWGEAQEVSAVVALRQAMLGETAVGLEAELRHYTRPDAIQRIFVAWYAVRERLFDSRDSDARVATPDSPIQTADANVGKADLTMMLVAILTNGVSDSRIIKAREVVEDESLDANAKLWKIDELISIPPTASARKLGKLVGVSGQMVMKTEWWTAKRKGVKRESAANRESRMRANGKRLERPRRESDD